MQTVPTERHEAVATSIDRLIRVGARIWEGLGTELDLTEVAAQALVAVDEGAQTVSGVADVCGRHVSSASRIVDTLVQRDLVLREEDPDDRRAVRLTLTAAGRAVAARISDLNARFLAACLDELEGAEVDELARLLGRLADAAEARVDDLA